MQRSSHGGSTRSNRPDASPLSSGPRTPMDDSSVSSGHRHRFPRQRGYPESMSNIDHCEPFQTPERNSSQQFERIVPSLSIDGNANANLIPTPHQAYPRSLSDGSFNNGAPEYSSQSGANTPTVDSSSVAHESTAGRRRGIIYRLALNDYKEGPINGTTFRYSLEPFKGLNRSDDPARHELAVMDLSSNVLGYWPTWKARRKNQLRDSFMDDDDKSPFVVGVDFISRSHTYYSIRIHSKRVLDCLRQLIEYYPDLGLALEQPEVSFEYPYRVLIHYYDDLQDMRNDFAYPGQSELSFMSNRSAKEDLDVVMGYVETIYESEIKSELALHQKKVPVAKFDALWLLFKPGETVFARIKGQLVFFKVLSANREIDKAGDPTGPWSIIVWGLYFDGYLLKRQSRKFKIHEYHGEREIQKLPVRPITFLTEDDGETETLIARGKRYYDFICDAPLYRRYQGPVNGDNADQYIGDVIVDPTGYLKEHANSKQLPGVFEVMFGARDQEDLGEVMAGDPPDFGGGIFSTHNDRVCSKDTPLGEDEHYLLLPGYIQGYALRGKQWMALNVDSFQPEETEEKPWESLVIEEKDFQLVESLAYSAKDNKGTEILPWTGDFIAGKGQGQVVLLHGPSGVGKTMTVECIATQMGRPLLCLTVADIGTKETEAEHNLAKWLGHASKWGAIVLIDEAETFLTKRKEGDLARNAIVAAFLRVLEYHQGMMFLTTNEPGRIDDAVMSRIHLAIEYRSLNKKQRGAIWRNLMGALEREQDKQSESVPKIKISSSTMNYVTGEEGIPDMDNLTVSGRDIRNAFQAAVRLARHEAGKVQTKPGQKATPIYLRENHFDRAFQSKLELKRNIDSIGGRTMIQRAHDDGLRRETQTA